MGRTVIAIPTYFGNKMVQNCVSSILQNVSMPEIRILKNDIGWLKACNQIMMDASTLLHDVILLNDDTFIVSDIVEEMTRVAYSDDKIGIVGGMALAPNGETVINYGIYVGTDGNTAHKHFGTNSSDISEKPEIQKAVEGSCMFIKANVIREIGVFDEEYGMGYREEVDYCFRAREAGYKVVSCPTAKYIHLVNQTHGKVGITNDKYEYFMSKWGSKLKLGEI